MKTVDQVLSQFTKVIDELEAVRAKQEKRTKQIISLRDRVARIADKYIIIGLQEQEKARNVIAKFKGLLDGSN